MLESSIGNFFLKISSNLFLSVLLATLTLLTRPEVGLGQQAADSTFAALITTAQQAQAARNYPAAADAYKQALRLKPNMAELWANLGLMKQQTGDISEAISCFQHANRLDQTLYVPNLFLGIDYVRTSKAKEAVPFLLKATKANDTDPEPRLALGRAYTALGEYRLAAQAYRDAGRLDPKQSSTWFALGITYLDQMENDSRKISESDQNSPYAKAFLAESLGKQSRYVEAARIYRPLIDATTGPPCLRSELGWSLLRQQDLSGANAAFDADLQANPECTLSILGKTRIAIENKNNDEALTLLTKTWTRDEGFFRSNISTFSDGLSTESESNLRSILSKQAAAVPAELRDSVLASLTAQASYATSSATWRHASATTQTIAQASHGTAETYYQSGEFERCSERLHSAISSPQASKLLLLTTCSYLTGDYELSSEAAAAAAKVAPRSTAALYWSVRANEKLAFQALAAYEQLEPNSARTHILLGDIFRQRSDYGAALAEYKTAQALNPTDHAAMMGMASAYLGNDDIDKAIESARGALQYNPDDPELNLIMAEALVAHHGYNEAEPYLTKSLTAKPQMLSHVHALLGRVYAEAGRNQDAIAELKMGLASDEDGSVHYQLARLYRETGDNKSAAEALEKMKEIQQRAHQQQVPATEDASPSDTVPQ